MMCAIVTVILSVMFAFWVLSVIILMYKATRSRSIRTRQEVLDDSTAVPPDGCSLSVGDVVTFTNENGVQFRDVKVVGFVKPEDIVNGRVVYLDYDCYWFPATVASLQLQVAR